MYVTVHEKTRLLSQILIFKKNTFKAINCMCLRSQCFYIKMISNV